MLAASQDDSIVLQFTSQPRAAVRVPPPASSSQEETRLSGEEAMPHGQPEVGEEGAEEEEEVREGVVKGGEVEGEQLTHPSTANTLKIITERVRRLDTRWPPEPLGA